MHPVVQYELQEIERLVERYCHGEDGAGVSPELAGVLDREVNRIKQTLVHEVFSFEDERHLERYIQYHQQALIRLMDQLDSRPFGRRKGDDGVRVFYLILDDLLSFVERHFTKYFDQDARAPAGYLALAKKDARQNFKKLQALFIEKGADLRVVNLLLQVLRKIIECSADKGVTYRKVMYAKEVQKELFRLAGMEVVDINEELRQVMCYLNYNAIKVVAYFAHHMNTLVEGAETRMEKIERLSLVLKNISQAQVKPGIGYNLHAVSLRSQLTEYITLEIEYHERLQRLAHRPPDSPTDNFLSGFKLKFEASVSQLAYLLRVLLETKYILNDNLTQVLHFLVRFVVTKRTENVSYGSFRAKFYNVEVGTKESVRAMLSTMIRYIDNH